MMRFLYLQALLSILLVCVNLSYANENVISEECNLFSGKWVYNSSLNPFYDSSTCPFIGSFDCLKLGRTDKEYLKYSWKPTSCDLPRFDGADLLNRWRGKKIMFVGDSIILDQWTSLVCMLHTAVPNSKITYVWQNPISYVKFEEYGVTIYLHTSHYLVDIVREERGRVMKLDSIHEQGDVWKGMDVLIFNSWHWWTFTGQVQEWDFVQYGSNVVKDMDRLLAFSKGLWTWATWIEQNIDPSKTKVFFQGISPDHYVGQEWGSNSNCLGEQRPLNGNKYPSRRPKAARVVENVFHKGLKNHAYLLDITTLSQLRKDAHPSRYTPAHLGSDCTHWCLPGLPDTWNQILYATLI